jgi:hypothetical protein
LNEISEPQAPTASLVALVPLHLQLQLDLKAEKPSANKKYKNIKIGQLLHTLKSGGNEREDLGPLVYE